MSFFFSEALLEWYKFNQRNHPWKQESDPYKIWLSEIIMQQTRVEQGTPYYLKFINTYPSIIHLSKAPLDEVLKLWEGLGYYSRARNMHHAAKEVVEKFDAQFPNTLEDLLSLKGIGKYTASAIASFAFKKPYPVVDGNVSRVLSRFFGVFEPIDSLDGIKKIELLALKVLNKSQSDIHNQAIMDFGAIVCKPANPLCDDCPLSEDCFAFQNEKQSELPIKQGKIIKKKRKINYLVVFDDTYTIIEQRKNNDIWKELYQFVEFSDTDDLKELIDLYLREQNMVLKHLEVKNNFKQTLSHQYIQADFYLCEVEKISATNCTQNIIIEKARIEEFAFPKIIRNFLNAHFFVLFSILNIVF